MVTIIVIYLASMLLSFCTIPVFVEKNIGIVTGLFLILVPVINTLWVLYFISKIIKDDFPNFISDLKKVFDIK